MLRENKNKEKENQKKIAEEEELPINDELFLSPIQKYRIYGKFPYKLVIHVLLVIGTSMQILLLNSYQTKFTRAQERQFYNLFVKDSDKTEYDFQRKKHLFSIDSLREHISKSLEGFYSFPKNSFDDVYFHPDQGDNPEVYMQVSYLKSTKNVILDHTFVYKINQTNFGPLDFSVSRIEAQNFLSRISGFQLNYTYVVLIPYYYGDNLACYIWQFNQIYSFIERAHLTVSLGVIKSACERELFEKLSEKTPYKYKYSSIMDFFARLVWLHIIVLLLAIVSLILIIRYFLNMFKLYWKVKQNIHTFSEIELRNLGFKIKNKSQDVIQKIREGYEEEEEKNDSGRTMDEAKESFLNSWSIIALFGNVIQIFGSGLCIFNSSEILDSTELLVGLGCFFSYLNLGKYMQNFKYYSLVYFVIQKSLSTTFRIFVGVMPIFLGFVFFSLCVFWKCERFACLSDTIASLFSIMNGDVMLDVLKDLKRGSYLIGQLFGYLFCILFVVVVMNIFLSAIGEAYVKTKLQNHNHWIYSYIKLGEDQKGPEKRDRSEDTEQDWKKDIREQMKKIGDFIDMHEILSEKIRKVKHKVKKNNKDGRITVTVDNPASIEKRKKNIQNNFYIYLQKNITLLDNFILGISAKLKKSEG